MRLDTAEKHLGVRSGKREMKVETADEQCSTDIWKQIANSESSVEEPEIEMDLRVEGVPEDVILKDEERMEEIDEKLQKLVI